jgi:hypothetical protein
MWKYYVLMYEKQKKGTYSNYETILRMEEEGIKENDGVNAYS